MCGNGWYGTPERRGRVLRALWVLSLWALLPGAVRAQDEAVGDIARLFDNGERVETTPRAELMSGDDVRYPRTRDPLYLHDLLRLRRNVAVGLNIDLPELRSSHVFSACANLAASDLPPTDSIGVGWCEEGLYEIREDPRRLRGFEFLLKSGIMTLRLLRGGLSVRAGGTRTHVNGTDVLFVADDTEGEEGIVFLRKGHINFPDFPDIQVGDDQAWLLRPGQAPVRLTLAPPAIRRWRKVFSESREAVFPRPFWQKPAFLVPAAAVVVGVGVLVLTGGSDGYEPPDGGPVNGRVIITFPQ